MHRTLLSVESKLKKTDKCIKTIYRFAKYLLRVLPMQRIVACIPIDESIVVFCDNIDSYTMKETSDYGITVRIAYEP